VWSEESEERRINIWQIEELEKVRMLATKAEANNQDPEQKKALGAKLEATKERKESKLIY